MKFNIKNIQKQIDWIDKNASYDDINNIEIYTSDTGYKINKELRYGQSPSKIIKGLDKIFNEIPAINTPIILYRTIDYDLGKEYKDLGFISTTYDLKTIYEPINEYKELKCCILEITVPSGSKIIPVEKYSMNKHEREILLNRGSKMVVTNETIKGGYKYLHMLYTPLEILETDNLKKVDSVNKKLERESQKLLKYILDNLEYLYTETKELDGDFNDFLDSIKLDIDAYQVKTDILDMTKEYVLNSDVLNLEIKKYKF